MFEARFRTTRPTPHYFACESTVPNRQLFPEDASTAAAIQTAIDNLADEGGGRLTLPELDLTLDRGLQLRDNIELVGQGAATILRKGPGRVYPLTGYHNYGMRDVPLTTTEGLVPGMTVSILDDQHRGFFSTFARITWTEDGWVGLDRGLQADYPASSKPMLTTAHPLIYGLGICQAAVRDLHLEGNAEQNPVMDACRGAALYLAESHNIEITGITERDFHGEGLGYQFCRDIRVSDCIFDKNIGNGFHPGAGSTKTSFHDCQARRNRGSGFFFCVRANHITVSNCTFSHNQSGMSIGTRDCYNVIRGCSFESNAGAGILLRAGVAPTEPHSLQIDSCRFVANGEDAASAQIEIEPGAHTMIIEHCQFDAKLGIRAKSGLRNLFLHRNDGQAKADLPDDALTEQRPQFQAGYSAATSNHWRHLI